MGQVEMVTMQDIAEKAGVNKGTVSYVLNGKYKKARIGSETCARIKTIAAELGYRRNELARSVATGKSNVIAFVSCDTGSWEYTGRIMAGILEEISCQNFSLKVFRLFNNDPLNIAEQIMSQRVAGVIFHSSFNEDFQLIYEEMVKNHVPCATTNLTSKSGGIGITSDDFQGARDAVRYLSELGHRRIVHLSLQYPNGNPEYVEERRKGYIAGVKEYLGKCPQVRIEFSPPIAEASQSIIKDILNEPPEQRPTAIFCISDAVALEVMQVAYRMCIKIPEELSVIGFADLEMARYAAVPLTTIAQPFEEMGKETATRLLQIINGTHTELSAGAKNQKLKVKLIVRESTSMAAAACRNLTLE